MARFYEEYGHVIVLLLTAGLGIAFVYWGLVTACHFQLVPPWFSIPLIFFDEALSNFVASAYDFVERRLQWFGAGFTLVTFAFGLVSGIRQAKRQLPKRLIEFMNEKVQPVHDNTELILAAMSPRMVDINRRTQFHRTTLEDALSSLKGGYRPSKRSTLDLTIREVETAIDVTTKRLQHLNDVNAHAKMLRGVLIEIETAETDQKAAIKSAEDDFTAAVANGATRLAGLELRGLSRTRDLNYSGALEDFSQLERESKKLNAIRSEARALRHMADVLRLQGQVSTLTKARRCLNRAKELFNTGKTLVDADWEEKGLNREAYGMVHKAIAGLAGSKTDLASAAFGEAIDNFKRMSHGKAEHIARVQQKLDGL